MKICLFSKNYGALDGCAQSVFDVIISLLESQVNLHVIYNKHFPKISQHDGFGIKGRLMTYQLPRKNVIDSIFYNKVSLSWKLSGSEEDIKLQNTKMKFKSFLTLILLAH